MSQPRKRTAIQASNGRPADFAHELTKGYAGRFIRFRAWKLAGTCGLSRSDRDDIEQELRIALLERVDKFDPDRGHWNVFVVTIVERAIASMFAPRRVADRTVEFEKDSLSTLVAAEDNEQTMLAQLVTPDQQSRINGRAVRNHEEEIDRVEDVAAVLESLPPDLREIAERLKTSPPAVVARELKIPRRTLRDRIEAIRRAFRDAGYGTD